MSWNRRGWIVLSRGARGAALICLAVAITGCSTTTSEKYYYPYSFDRDRAGAVRKVAVAPMNLLTPAPPFVGPKGAVVYTKLVAYVTSHGLTAETAPGAGRVWEDEKRQAGGIYSSQTGQIDSKKFRNAVRNTVSKVCKDLSVDALVFPEVVVRRATMQETNVYWDGAEERIVISAKQEDGFQLVTGNSSALSLNIMVVNRDGRILLRNIGGIEHHLIATVEGLPGHKKLGWETKRNVLTDDSRIEQAIAVSLHPMIPFAGYPEAPRFLKE